jgi:hypothetical protein
MPPMTNPRTFIPKMLACLLWCSMVAHENVAQVTAKPKTSTRQTSADTLMPKLQVRFGPYRAGTPVLPDDFKRVLNTELVVTDSAKGTAFVIKSFRFGWRRKEASDDMRTGKRKIITTFSAVEVANHNKLPAAWQKELSTNLQAKEELLFEAIIVQHPVTKKMFMAPSLVLKLL